MIEVLEFIFQDFYHYIGTLCLLAVVFSGSIITINRKEK